MSFLTWAALGLLVGALAKFIMPGKQGGGIIKTTLLGVAGALLGGFVGSKLGMGSVSGFNVPSLVLAVGGAILLLLLLGRVRGKK